MAEWLLHATAASGLEAVVKKECEDLGFPNPVIEAGHILFSGGVEEVALANLALAVADRIAIELGRFEAKSYEAFFEGVRALDWPTYLGADGAFPVQARAVKSRLMSASDLQRLGKKAIATALEDHFHLDHCPEAGPTYPVSFLLRDDVCQVLLDTSGEGLFKRGYRKKKGAAPLKETLAAGLVRLSFWTPDRPLLDPFCGSGTILIEAARMARGIDPGLDRDFLAMTWPWIGQAPFRRLRRQRMERIHLDGSLDLMGFDLDQSVILSALANARGAGVEEDLTLVPKAMQEARLKENFGVVITNPPYGHRLEAAGSDHLLAEFADHFRALRTWSLFVITPSTQLEDYMGRPATRRRKLYNGGLETTYYQFHGPNPARFR